MKIREDHKAFKNELVTVKQEYASKLQKYHFLAEILELFCVADVFDNQPAYRPLSCFPTSSLS